MESPVRLNGEPCEDQSPERLLSLRDRVLGDGRRRAAQQLLPRPRVRRHPAGAISAVARSAVPGSARAARFVLMLAAFV